jgi:hypothetical protein
MYLRIDNGKKEGVFREKCVPKGVDANYGGSLL